MARAELELRPCGEVVPVSIAHTSERQANDAASE